MLWNDTTNDDSITIAVVIPSEWMKGRRLKSSASPNNNNDNNDKKKEKKRQERPAPNESIGSETARKTSESFSSKANDVSLFAVPKKK